MSRRIVVVGAGVGGLTAAALLARAGQDVTLLEAHVSPGGCAATFFHRGYRFDAGATLPAGFYPGGPMDRLGRELGIERWPVRPVDPAMVVHLPQGDPVALHAGQPGAPAEHTGLGPNAAAFWRWQEATADALWDLALRNPPWPPQTAGEAAALVGTGLRWLGADLGKRLRPGLALDAVRPVATHLRGASERMRLLVDGQLLISAQTPSAHANALYGASALDLPRRGVMHAAGGMGAIAQQLVEALQAAGGQVHFRQEATRIVIERGRPTAVETRKGDWFPADAVVANATPWNVARLMGDGAPDRLRRLPEQPRGLWGAFMVYVGLDGSALPPDVALHHQVLRGEPLGNGNSVFLSLSPAWDATRAPAGKRALTLSTHTELGPWWDLFESDRDAYEERKRLYTERVLAAAEVALPDLRAAAELVLPGTPVTFQRYTRRAWGWVGGFPQTSLTRAWGPCLAPGLWLVGDSIFPGQSVPAVALGGLRVAQAILDDLS